MKAFLGAAAAAALFLSTPMALAQAGDGGENQFTTSYCAYLSEADHHNSKGVRLTNGVQVLRQDRANFHRFGIRDEHDETDDLFMSAENRALIEKAIINLYLNKAQQNPILDNQVYVCVSVYTMPTGQLRLEVVVAN